MHRKQNKYIVKLLPLLYEKKRKKINCFSYLYIFLFFKFFFQALIALWIPGAIFGGMCLLVVVLALRLPESATHELPSTIAECDKWERDTVSSSDATHDSSSEEGEKLH
jgi:hypothetical protein